MNILVRLPNWLGDLVMSTAFIRALRQQYPDAVIDVICKKGMEDIAGLCSGIDQIYGFNKSVYRSLTGVWRFGKEIRRQKQYDLFFTLPDSFSGAVMGYATGAKKRIGFRNEGRSILLTNSYPKPADLHRADEYVLLLEEFSGKRISDKKVELASSHQKSGDSIIINFNSEAASRRMPVQKAVDIMKAVQQQTPNHQFTFIGSSKEKSHVDAIVQQLPFQTQVINKAGTTSLAELVKLITAASLMLTTDSGPAHLANALGVHTIVLFGAGNEKNTAPYNDSNKTIVRNGLLPCEPCIKNTCKFGEPKCLLELDITKITSAINQQLK